MRRERDRRHQEDVNRWLISYADLITLLFATFVILYALAQSDSNSLDRLQNSIRLAFASSYGAGVLEEGEGIFDKSETPINPFILEEISPKYEQESFDRIKEDVEKIVRSERLKGVKVKVDERGLAIIINDNAELFPNAQAKLNPDSVKILDIIGRIITNKFKTHQIRVEGHTASLPLYSEIYPSNWELSCARASSVVRFFVSNFNVSPEMLSVVGYGDSRPMVKNGNVINGRVEILIVRNRYKHFENLVQNESIKQFTPAQDVKVRETYLKEREKKEVLKKPKFMKE